jgi:hypothetical protein
MPSQIVLSWDVDVTNTVFGPAQAAIALAAVPLYQSASADPVLGQLFGLTVGGDVTSQPSGSTARRTLTLNMATPQLAPPSFPCHPRTSTPPELPYPLRTTRTLAGSFFVSNGSMNVPTSATQQPALNIGDSIQFMVQQGVFYTVASVSGTTIGLTAPYTGVTGNSGAFKEVLAPVTRVAVYSTSPLDTTTIATVPTIPAGSGAQTVILSYKDSTGASFTTSALLTGKRPAAFTLAPGSVDIAEIDAFFILAAGSFGNSVGQITLVELSSPLPPIPPDATPFDFLRLTDQAQLLISRSLAYLPPSYFALAQQGASETQLAGDFTITTGSTNVPTTVDQTGVLSPGSIIRFAEQDQDNRQLHVDVLYTVAHVTPKFVTLARPFTGVDSTKTGVNTIGTSSNIDSKGTVGAKVTKVTGAILPALAAPPTNDQLSVPLGQFVAPEVAMPPPNPPLSPSTVPAPVFLSGLFTQTIQLALAGVPITPQPIAIL